MSEEHNIYHLNTPYNPLAGGASVTHLYPHIVTLNPSNPPAFTLINTREYNDLLSQRQNLQAVIRNVTHYLIAKQDIGELSAVEDALLLACEQAMNQEAV